MAAKSKPAAKGKLAARREAYRLWFEYLRLAHQSNLASVKKALAVSEPFYRAWNIKSAVKFDDWWKSHGHLFEEQFVVRTLSAGEKPLDPNALIIEVPLTMSPTLLIEKVGLIIRSAYDADEKANRKSKKKATAIYRLSDGAEPKLDAVREMLTVYRDVYLKNPNLRGEKLLKAAQDHYLARKNKRWAKVPMALLYEKQEGEKSGSDDIARPLRNLRRYIQKAEKIMLNVANGHFPGEY